LDDVDAADNVSKGQGAYFSLSLYHALAHG